MSELLNKKIYLIVGIIVVAVFLIGGIFAFLHQPREAVSPEEEELTNEMNTFSQDIDELNELGEEGDLDTLDEDLGLLAEESGGDSIGDIETSVNELDSELDDLLADLDELETYQEDSSLSDLDDILSAFSQ
ncbi:hypothetical protein J7K24_00600 [bacterium]|nr:hypothetical protein [bacterium]